MNRPIDVYFSTQLSFRIVFLKTASDLADLPAVASLPPQSGA